MKINKCKSIPDLTYNLQDFPDKSNILFVTGLSGSGKSYLSNQLAQKYDATVFQPEWLIHPKHISTGFKPLLEDFLQEYPNIKNLVENKWNNCKKESENAVLKKYINLFFQKFLNNCKPDKLYIVEGLQIFTLLDIKYIKNKPLIIKGSSCYKSLSNRIKRDMLNHKSDKLCKQIKKYFSILKQSKEYQFNHRKLLNKFIQKL